MGIFNRAIPNVHVNNIGQVQVHPQDYYVDDIFDPLFNANVRRALTAKYGSPFLGTIGGYLEGIDNALIGQDDQWGILGPGMGILSGFGRSMDKAGDAILGTLTEGVKGITGQGWENPLRNIFVEDQDYTGGRLLAAMGNSMAQMSGAPQLTEADFGGFWKVPAIGVELATDPGILGNTLKRVSTKQLASQVAQNQANPALANVGQLLSDYDDLMAKVSIDVTAPGLRPALRGLSNRIKKLVAGRDYAPYAETVLNRTKPPEERKVAHGDLTADGNLGIYLKMNNDVKYAESAIPEYPVNFDNSTDIPAPTSPDADDEELLDLAFNDVVRAYETSLDDILKQEELESKDIQALQDAFNTQLVKDAEARTLAEEAAFQTEPAKRFNTWNTDLSVNMQQSVEDLNRDRAYIQDALRELELNPELRNTLGINPEYWSRVPSPDNVPEDDLMYALTDNVATNNAILTYAGLDPKSKARINIEETPFTLSPSKYKNNSNETLIAAVRASNAKIARVFKRYPELDFSSPKAMKTSLKDSKKLKHVIPDEHTRNRFINLLTSIRFPNNFKVGKSEYSNSVRGYLDNVQELINLIVDDVKTPTSINILGRNFALDTYLDTIGHENFSVVDFVHKVPFKKWMTAQIHTSDLGFALSQDEVLKLTEIAEKLSKADLITKDTIDTNTLKALGLESLHPNTQEYVVNQIRDYRKLISNLKTRAGLKKSPQVHNAYNDLIELADDLESTVFMPLKRRQGAVRSINPYSMEDMRLNPSTKDGVVETVRSDGDSYNNPNDISNSNLSDTVVSDVESAVDISTKDYLEDSSEREYSKGTRDVFTNLDNKYREHNPNAAESLSYHAVLNNLVRLNKHAFTDPKDVYDFVKPLLEYYDVNINPSYFKLPKAEATVDNFVKEVLPEVEQIMQKGYTPFHKKGKVPKGLAKLESLLDRNPAYRTILSEIVQDPVFTRDVSGKLIDPKKLPAVLKNYNPDDYASYQVIAKELLEDPNSEAQLQELLADVIDEMPSLAMAQYAKRYKNLTAEQIYNLPKSQMLGWIDYRKLYGKGREQLASTLYQKAFLTPPRKQLMLDTSEGLKDAMRAEFDISKDLVRQNAKRAANAVESAAALIQEAPAKSVAPVLFEQTSAQSDAVEDVAQFIINVQRGGNNPIIPTTAEQLSDPKPDVWRLTEHISATSTAPTRAAVKNYATLRIKNTEELINRASKVSDFSFIKYRRRQQGLAGDTVFGKNFLTDIVSARGVLLMPFSGKDTAHMDAFVKTLNKNIADVNVAMEAEVLVPIKQKLSNGNWEVGVALNTKNHEIVKVFYKKAKKALALDLNDLEILPKGTQFYPELADSPEFRELDSIFSQVQESYTDYAKMLGFDLSDSEHRIKNVKRLDADAADTLANELYRGLDTNALEDISSKIANLDEFRPKLRGTFGALRSERRLRGDVTLFENNGVSLFTESAAQTIKGTFAEGMLDNKKFQTYVDLFVNQNYNIHQFCKTPDDLRKILYQTLPDGRMSGNLHNLAVVSPRFNAEGRLVGFTRYDALNPISIDRAFADPNTVLLPENVLAPLDKVLRKDAKMSNKVFAFINKYLTLPFKFGVLMNPGFLLGNMSDAYLKQATTMSEKYNTSVSEELARVSASIAEVMQLNNEFDELYRRFLVEMESAGYKLAPSDKISELAAANPKIRKQLLDFCNNKLRQPGKVAILPNSFNKDELGTIRLWLMLNSTQTASTFDKGFQDFEEFAKAANKSKYDVPTNPIERIFTGKGRYVSNDVSTWGLFANNPIANKIMQTSENIENVFRSASILNDLRHSDIGLDYIRHYLGYSGSLPEDVAVKINVKMNEAINAMHHANFDYEQMSDFTDFMGTFIPFPTFFLKNLGYWVELFVNNPQYVDHAITIQQGLWSDRDTSKDEFAASAKGRGGIPIGGHNLSNFFKGIYKPAPLNSMFGAFSLLNNPVEDMYYRLNPALASGISAAAKVEPVKSIAAHTLPTESIKYRPYSTDMYERNIKLGDPNFNPLSYAVHRMNPLDRTVNTALRVPEKVKKNEAQLSDFLPSVFQPEF